MAITTGRLTVDDAFGTMLQRVELNSTRVTLASTRYQAVKDVIEAALPGCIVKQIGSFQRKTKIRPGDLGDGLDVDVLVIFGSFTRYAVPPNGRTAPKAIEIVRQALVSNDVYKVMEPENDAPVVVLEYADESTFKIELVPAYIDKTGDHNHLEGDVDCYIVPATSGNWQVADYDFDALTISAVNQRADVKGMLVPFIKIAKTFLRNTEVPLKSFHIEVLATLIVSEASASWSNANYTWGYQHLLAEFLRKAAILIAAGAVKLPGSYSPALNSGLSTAETADVVYYLNNRADEAWRLCALKDKAGVLEDWRKLIGDPFPVA